MQVEIGQEITGIVRLLRTVSHQRAKDGGDQGGTGAMPHDVRDENAGAVFIQLDEIEEIPADRGGWLIEMGEFETQRVIDRRRRHFRVLRGQLGVLEFAGHFKVLADDGGLGGDFGLQLPLVAQDPRGHDGQVLGQHLDFVSGADRLDRLDIVFGLGVLFADFLLILMRRLAEPGDGGDRARGIPESSEWQENSAPDEVKSHQKADREQRGPSHSEPQEILPQRSHRIIAQ